MTKTKPKAEMTERTIASYERTILRWTERKKVIRSEAEDKCAIIDKDLAKKRVLLDALKKGSLAP